MKTKKIFSYSILFSIFLYASVFSQWSHQNSGTKEWFISNYFVNSSTGWIVGYNGTILKTVDGGSTWIQQFSGTTKHLLSVYFVDSNFGLAVGGYGTILKTTDGGKKWKAIQTGILNRLRSVRFINKNVGWVCGENGLLWKTVDGGISWTPKSSNTNEQLNSIFILSNNIWAVGRNGTIIKSDDSGNNWKVINPPTNNHLNSVYFVNPYLGWAVGDHGTILKTKNGGNSWVLQNAPVEHHFFSVYFVNKDVGYIVGGLGYNRQTLGASILTINGGETWKEENVDNSNKLYSVNFPDPDHGWAVGYNGTMLKYTGENFTCKTHNVNYRLSIDFPCLDTSYTSQIGHFCEGNSFIIEPQKLPGQISNWQNLYDALVGTRVGIENGALNENVFLDIKFQQFDCSSYGKYIKPTASAPPLFMFLGIEVTGDSSGITPTDEYYYFNKGKRAFICIPRSYSFLSLLDSLGIDPNNLEFAYYLGGEYFKDGLEWELKKGETGKPDSVCIYLNHFSKIVGSSSDLVLIIKESDKKIPAGFVLQQNYPNPFNPLTKISYNLPSRSYVKLQIFDTLGKVVTELVNGKQQKGFYQVSFDASNLSSGVYFYGIEVKELDNSNSYRKVKKLVLMK